MRWKDAFMFSASVMGPWATLSRGLGALRREAEELRIHHSGCPMKSSKYFKLDCGVGHTHAHANIHTHTHTHTHYVCIYICVYIYICIYIYCIHTLNTWIVNYISIKLKLKK